MVAASTSLFSLERNGARSQELMRYRVETPKFECNTVVRLKTGNETIAYMAAGSTSASLRSSMT